MRRVTTSTGFTVLEVLVVIGLFAILATIGLFFSIDFYRTYSLNSEQNTLVSVLSKARARSLANLNQHQHGVYIGGSDYTLFQGTVGQTYSDPGRDNSLDETIPRGAAMNVTGATEIIFSPLSGNTDCPSGCVMTLSGQGRSHVVTINNQGAILW